MTRTTRTTASLAIGLAFAGSLIATPAEAGRTALDGRTATVTSTTHTRLIDLTWNGRAVNHDNDGDYIGILDRKKGPDDFRLLAAGRASSKRFDVDRVSAPCKEGVVVKRRIGKDRVLGWSYELGKGEILLDLYVNGC